MGRVWVNPVTQNCGRPKPDYEAAIKGGDALLNWATIVSALNLGLSELIELSGVTELCRAQFQINKILSLLQIL